MAAMAVRAAAAAASRLLPRVAPVQWVRLASSGAAPAGGGGGGGGSGEQTHFGFQTVDAADKQRMVGDVFRRVADSYDVMNDVMSGTVHRLWKDEFVRRIGPIASSDKSEEAVVLDVAGGTGDIAFRIVDSLARTLWQPATKAHVIVSDINEHMLGVGKERAIAKGYINADGSQPASVAARMTFKQGNAEALPFPDASVDLYTIAFGIRNVTHVDAALRDAFRVLKPGGRFMCLEFSTVTNPAVRALYDAYSFNVIPAMGEVVARDRASYQYLVESIRKFPDQDTFADMMRAAGFRSVTYTNFTFGVAAMHSGFKWAK